MPLNQARQIVTQEDAPLALPAHFRVVCPHCAGVGDDDDWRCAECHGEGQMTFSVCEINGELIGWHYEGRCLVSFMDADEMRSGIAADRWAYRGLERNGLRDARVLDILQIPHPVDEAGRERLVEQTPFDGLAKAGAL